MRLATWNVNSVKARLPRLLDWLADKQPDVVCLQEIKCAEAAFPADEVGELGYETAAHGDGRWNGVAILSKVGLADVTRGFAGDPGYAGEPEDGNDALFPTPPDGPPPHETRAIGATCDGVRVWSVYVPNGRVPDSPHYRYKLAWLEAFREVVTTELPNGPFGAERVADRPPSRQAWRRRPIQPESRDPAPAPAQRVSRNRRYSSVSCHHRPRHNVKRRDGSVSGHHLP